MTEGVTFMPIVIEDLKAERWRTLAAAGMGGGAESPRSEDIDRPDEQRPDEPMKSSNQLQSYASLLTIPLWAGAWGILSPDLPAAEPKDTQPQPVVSQRLFASPEE